MKLSFPFGLLLLSTTNFITSASVPNRTIFIGVMAPLSGSRAWWGAGIPVAIEMAFDYVNNRSDILPGYNLKLVPRDTKVLHPFVNSL